MSSFRRCIARAAVGVLALLLTGVAPEAQAGDTEDQLDALTEVVDSAALARYWF